MKASSLRKITFLTDQKISNRVCHFLLEDGLLSDFCTYFKLNGKCARIPPSIKFWIFKFSDLLYFNSHIRRVYIAELVLYIWKQKKQYAIVLGMKSKPVFCEPYISSFPNSSATSTKPVKNEYHRCELLSRDDGSGSRFLMVRDYKIWTALVV